MSTTWDNILDWKKKALLVLTLISAANINAQNPYRNVPEAPMDEAFAMLGNTRSSNTVISEHPAYTNRNTYRQTGYDQEIIKYNNERYVWDSFYSRDFNPEYSRQERLSGVYRNLDREDNYVMVYSRRDGTCYYKNTKGTNLRDMWEFGSHGFYAHPNFNQRGHYGPNHNLPHGHSRVGEAVHGVVDVVNGIQHILNATRGK